MKNSNNILFIGLIAVLLLTNSTIHSQDLVADNMLLFQRSYGGWPKHFEEKAINYKRDYTVVEKATITDDIGRNDATIDNDATTKEIWYLAKAYKAFKNPKYLVAVENGIRYLLKAQYQNGGWPQFYPDSSLYRSEITYNDNAMINALKVLQDVVLKRNNLDIVDTSLIAPSKAAVEKGIDCILKTQIRVKGKLTVWCAQYDAVSLKPAKARTFELVSLSGNESVGIVEFLMEQPYPSQAIKDAINSAVAWFNAAKIVGYNFVDIPAPGTPKGKDRVFVQDPNSTIWARFYDIDTNEPFFSGRDSQKKKYVKDIEYERRNGYAWYGTWPAQLLANKYPNWVLKNQ
ncbi:pectate lyase [Parasediminibacterium paludis]|uniref:Pectate lyase n=1 Tax=Parasediminibacterium paludis TaxID=908966 RepID=A0ABV8PWJ1_9BACT